MITCRRGLHIAVYSPTSFLSRYGPRQQRNMIPFDTKSPFITSGIRIGTAAATTRGMKEPEMERIADFINEVVTNYDNDEKLASIRKEVRELCDKFPLYPELAE